MDVGTGNPSIPSYFLLFYVFPFPLLFFTLSAYSLALLILQLQDCEYATVLDGNIFFYFFYVVV